jgi:hypothetical protein
MNAAASVLIASLAGAVGFFAGREHLKYEVRAAASGMVNAVTKSFAPPAGKFTPEEGRYAAESIELYDFTASWETLLSTKHVAVKGKVRNTGQFALRTVQLTFSFLDESGATIYEQVRHSVTTGNFAESTPPMSTGHIREVSHYFDRVPSEWKEGAVKITISDLEFATESE